MHVRPIQCGLAAAVLLSADALAARTAAGSATPFQCASVALDQVDPLTREEALAAAALQGPPTQSGQVVITEVMKDPSSVSDTRGEWIEVWNNMPWRVNLEGCTLSDDAGNMHVIDTGGAGLRFGPGRYLVLGSSTDQALNGGVQVDYAWSGFSLSNGADQIVITRPDGTLVDRVAYDDGVLWPDQAGRSISLRMTARTATGNDDPANWCHATSPISATNADMGTPRLDNDACP